MICYFDPASVLDVKLDVDRARVRKIISSMRYKSLLRRKIIPDLELLTERISKAKYPNFVKSQGDYPKFGMFLDYVLRKYFSFMNGITADFGIEPTGSSNDTQIFNTSINVRECVLAANRLAASLLNMKPFQESDIIDAIPWIDSVCKTMMAKWEMRFGSRLRYNVVLSQKTAEGHPDIVTENAIWDIKCGCTQKPQRQQTFLQILAYWALSDDSNINTIGVIFPLSATYRYYDMSGWSKTLFRHELISVAKSLLISEAMTSISLGNGMMLLNHPDIMEYYPVGSHVINQGIVESIKYWIGKCMEVYNQIRPMQMYLANPRGKGQSQKTLQDIDEAKYLIQSYGVSFYTHAALAINLCSTQQHVSKCIIDDLILTRELGGKGVVVHLGKCVGEDLENALRMQTEMLRKCLPYSSTECKILLETPAGKGSEVCADLDSLNQYLGEHFTFEERNLLGICLDTCHVFVSGASPIEYIRYWMENGNAAIGLVHFNDSKKCFGYCVDGHEYPGRGKIGYDEMVEVAKFCAAHGIDMVYE